MKHGNEIFFYCKPAIAGDTIWSSALNSSQLCKLNLKSCECIKVKSFQEKKAINLYSEAVLGNDDIFFIPFDARKIAVYSLTSKQLSYIDFIKNHCSEHSSFYKASVTSKYIFIFPCRSKYCLRIDLFNHNIDEFGFFCTDDEEDAHTSGLPYILKGGCLFGNLIILGMVREDSLRIIDTNNGSVISKRIPFEMDGISCLECVNNCVWILGRNGRILTYHIVEGKYDKYDVLFNAQNGVKTTSYGVFFDTVVHEGIIYISHSFESKISALDTTTGDIITRELPESDRAIGSSIVVRFPSMYIYNSCLNILDGFSGKTFCLSLVDLRIISVFSPIFCENITIDEWPENEIVVETKGNNISNMLDILLEED